MNIRALGGLARIALAALLLVVIPLSDAAACAREDIAASAVVDDSAGVSAELVSGDVAHGPQAPGDGQHCIHGHCHHSVPMSDIETGGHVLLEGSVGVIAWAGDFALSRVVAGLERPPRA